MNSHTYYERPPSPRLAPYVECYWFGESPHARPGRVILPDGCVDILFERRSAELTAVGLMTRPGVVDIAANSAHFGVRFRPAMASAFLEAAPELTDRIEPLEKLWGARARRLREPLADARTDEDLIAAMERVLAPREIPRLEALRTLALPPGHAAACAGISPRHLRRVTLEAAGVPPKYLRRILRFRAAAGAVRALRTPPNWAHFAAGHGYYDQAHFIREFREFAGATPGRFLQSQFDGA